MAEQRPYRSQYSAEQIVQGWENQVPRINPLTGNWETWDIATQRFVDSGTSAEGEVTGGVADVRVGGTSVVNPSGIANVNAVLFDTPQSLTDSAKQVARTNIGAPNAIGTVAGGKNLLNPNTYGDKVVNANGALRKGYDVSLKAGTYIVSRSATNVNWYLTYVLNGDWVQTNLYLQSNVSHTFTLANDIVGVIRTDSTDASAYITNLQLEEGSTATPYESYCDSNLQLTRKQNIVNLLNPTGASSGIITNNGDGTYTLNGSTGSTQFSLTIAEVYLNKGIYKICGVPKGTDAYIRLGVGAGNTHVAGVNANDYILNVTEYNLYKLNIILPANKTANNVVFKPMITTNLDATYDDFIEYGYYDSSTSAYDVATIYGTLKVSRNGNVVSVYGLLTNMPQATAPSIASNTLPPTAQGYQISPLFSNSSPYNPIDGASVWVNSLGGVTIYKPTSVSSGYISFTYVCV